jgi:hypothetical protein
MDREDLDHRLAEMRKEHSEEQAALPLGFVSMLPALTRAAKSKGYALAVHGSMRRDLDLVAIPWTEEAASAQEVVDALIHASSGFLRERETKPAHPEGWPGTRDPAQKPHGRLAWSIYLAVGGTYIDLSVMPRCRGCGASEVK